MEVQAQNLQPRTVIGGVRGEGWRGRGETGGGGGDASTEIERRRKAGSLARKK